MNLLDILSTSPHYFCGNEYGQQMKIHILMLGFKGLNLKKYISLAFVQRPLRMAVQGTHVVCLIITLSTCYYSMFISITSKLR